MSIPFLDRVRFSAPTVLVLLLCVLVAEHRPPREVHAGFQDRETFIEEGKGQLPREVAYLVLGTVGSVAMFSTIKARRRAIRFNRRFVVPLGMLLGWSTLSLLWSDSPMVSAKRLAVLWLTLIGAFGLVCAWTRDEVLKFIAFTAAAHLTIGLFAEIVSGYFSPSDMTYRFAGTLTWNQQGYACMVLVLASLCLLAGMRQSRWLYGFLASYGFSFLLLTRSRSALMALGISLLLYLFLVSRSVVRMLALLVCSALAVILVTAGAAPRLLGTLNRGGEGSEDLTGRVPLWQELMTYADRHALIGYGYEAFWTDSRIDDVSDDQHWPISSAHSGYLECLLMLGAVGLTLHVLTLSVGFLESIRLYRAAHAMIFYLGASLCCIYLTGGVLESTVLIKVSPISFYMALLCGVLSISREESTEVTSSVRSVTISSSLAPRTQLLAR